jgi:hypothetical protein
VVDLNGGWPIVAGAGGLAGFLDAIVVVAASLDGRGLVRCRRGGLIFLVIWARTSGRTSVQRR